AFVVPPLRERREEIPLLLQYFAERMGMRLGENTPVLSSRVIEPCLRYRWPGNVRELENFVKRYLILGDDQGVISELDTQRVQRLDAGSRNGGGEVSDLKMLVKSLKENAEREA